MMMHGNAEKLTFWKMTDVILQIIMQNMVTVNMDSQTEMIADFHVSHVDLAGTSTNMELNGGMFYSNSMMV